MYPFDTSAREDDEGCVLEDTIVIENESQNLKKL